MIRAACAEVHEELCELVASYKLPPMPGDVARKIKASAAKILDGIMLRCLSKLCRPAYRKHLPEEAFDSFTRPSAAQ